MNTSKFFPTVLFAAMVMALGAASARAQMSPAETPVLSPPGGSFVDFVDITITTTTPGATIYYTLDGTPPTTSSFPYVPGQPIEIFESAVVQAIAVAPGFLDSAVASGNFVVTPLPTPTITLHGKKLIKTSKPTIKLRGTSTGAESVEYALGDEDFQSAKGTAHWSFKAKLLPGKNVFTIFASGEEEDSDPITVTVRRIVKK